LWEFHSFLGRGRGRGRLREREGEGERGRKNKLFREEEEEGKIQVLVSFIEERKAKVYPSFPFPLPFLSTRC
jgi:hypothetical protein